MADATVGIVGLGIMGSAWYHHLLAAGFEVIGYDILEDKLRALEEAGGKRGSSPADVASRVPVLVTSLDRAEALEAVVSGPDGITQASDTPDDLVVVETSTLPLAAKEAAYRSLDALGITMLDCTISGTGHQARTRDIALYASGDTDAIARCRPVFEAVARATNDVGEFGNGSKLKFIANHLVAVHNLATAEALLLAERSGLDLQQVLEVIANGAGTSRMWEIRGPVMVGRTYDEPAARLKMFMKDMGIIGQHATDVASPVPLFSAALPFYSAAMAQGREDQDAAALIAVLRRLAGMSETEEEAPS